MQMKTGKPIRRRAAFTLLETIGVLAVVAVLAGTLLPAWIKRIDIATRNQEKARLREIAEALGQSVLRAENVPDHTTWRQRVVDFSPLPMSRIASNARRYQRVYYTLENPSLALPYTQDAGGAVEPQRLRAVVVSVLGGAALNYAVNSPAPGPLNEAQFAALWDLPDGARPTNDQWANWEGRGDDFLVSRVDYAPMFHRLVLVNRDPNATPTYKIDASGAIQLPKTSPDNTGLDRYYVNGTIVGLGDPSGTPMAGHMLTRDISFVFEHGMWRAQITGGTETLTQAEDFGVQAARFLSASWWTGAAKGADQQTALVAMYAFMLTYTFWADLCPHFPLRTSSAVNVPEYKLLLDYGAINGRLDDITGPNGLLNK